jgi:osmotically-inducible protein OsmY
MEQEHKSVESIGKSTSAEIIKAAETPNQLEQEPTVPNLEETLERTAGIRQGDPDDTRYAGPSGVADSGFGTGQGDYGGSDYSVGSPRMATNYHPGYGIVPGYGAKGTQGVQGIEKNITHEPPSHDTHVRRDVLERLAQQSVLASCSIEVEVVNSIVTLRGHVQNIALKRLAYQTLEPMREVRAINNQLEVENS